MFLLRGFEFTHEAVRDWEERFAPLLTEQLRRKRKGKVGRRWYVDETYLKVKGKWCYLYRAIDREGNLVDSMLSATRDMDAAQRFFHSTQFMVNEAPPDRSPPTATIRIRVPSGKCSGPRCNIAAARTSTVASSRITAESNSGIIRCWASASFGRPSAFAGPSRKFDSTFDPVANATKLSRSPTADDCSCSEY